MSSSWSGFVVGPSKKPSLLGYELRWLRVGWVCDGLWLCFFCIEFFFTAASGTGLWLCFIAVEFFWISKRVASEGRVTRGYKSGMLFGSPAMYLKTSIYSTPS